MSGLPIVLTIPQVCEQLGVKSTDTVYRLISNGSLDTCDVSVYGRPRTRVTRESLERYVQARTRNAKRAAS